MWTISLIYQLFYESSHIDIYVCMFICICSVDVLLLACPIFVIRLAECFLSKWITDTSQLASCVPQKALNYQHIVNKGQTALTVQIRVCFPFLCMVYQQLSDVLQVLPGVFINHVGCRYISYSCSMLCKHITVKITTFP